MVQNDYSVGDIFAKRFILISLVYFIIGTLWMGPFSLLIPGPSGIAGTIYDTGRMHLVFVGFLVFFVIGAAYYLGPRIGGKQLSSRRLASIHFWATNIIFPVAVGVYVTLPIVYQSIVNSPSFSPSNMPGGLFVLYILTLLLMFIGIGFQGVLSYNIYRTVFGQKPQST